MKILINNIESKVLDMETIVDDRPIWGIAPNVAVKKRIKISRDDAKKLAYLLSDPERSLNYKQSDSSETIVRIDVSLDWMYIHDDGETLIVTYQNQ